MARLSTLLFALTLLLAWGRAHAAPPFPPSGSTPSGSTVPPQPPHRIFLPLVRKPGSRVLLAAAHIDSAVSGERDEGILLWNLGPASQPLAGWRIRGNGRTATFPLTTTLTLAPGQQLWCAREAQAFAQTFGFAPGCEWGADTDPQALDLTGSRPALTNHGGEIQILDSSGRVVDALLYGDEALVPQGWTGPAAQLYARGDLPEEGQVWRRKVDPESGLPLDTDRAQDWAGDAQDLAWGRRVYMPGWALWETSDWRSGEEVAQATARVTVAVGPEGLYQPVAELLAGARERIWLSLYTFEHPELATLLAQAAARGVEVRLLLEGGPSGGITELQRWCLAQIQAAGGQVRYMAAQEGAPRGYRSRYRFLHAKYGVVDGRTAFVSSENFTRDSMPLPGAGVTGRRGVALLTDAAPVVTTLQQIFLQDWAPDRFLDLRPFTPGDPTYGGPAADFLPPSPATEPLLDSPFAAPVTQFGEARFQVITSPDASLDPDRGLFALLEQAGPGDQIWVTQLYEHKFWGEPASNPVADPNPRLQAFLEAARRGAQVRLLLDSFFDDPAGARSNQATVTFLSEAARREGLDLEARLGNPTGLGIHAKVVLVKLGAERWSGVGSLNGSEVSYKLNRELLLLTDAPAIHQRLAEVFQWDWERSSP